MADAPVTEVVRYWPPLIDDTEVRNFQEALIEEIGETANELAKKVDQLPPSNHADVGSFHQKFGLPNTTYQGVFPREVVEEFMRFRINFLREELKEIEAAVETGDLVKLFDGLLDLNYVSHGTAHILGLPWQAGWCEVQRANMTKERASETAQGTRPWQFDVRKPEGWTPPDIKGVLERFGWDDETMKFPPIKLDDREER